MECRPNLDDTITVEKKSLFSVLNDDSDLSIEGTLHQFLDIDEKSKLPPITIDRFLAIQLSNIGA